MITEPQSSLATFVDRHTMVYDRWYPHDIALVFEVRQSKPLLLLRLHTWNELRRRDMGPQM